MGLRLVNEGIDGYLGIAYTEPSLIIRNFNQSYDKQFYLDLNLFREQIEALEKVRNGRGLKFVLDLSSEVIGFQEPYFVTDRIRLEVNQSQWLSILSGMRYSNIMLYEVKQPFESTEKSTEYQEIHNSLRNAQGHYLSGEYNDAVADCRIALEQLETLREYRLATKNALSQYCSSNFNDKKSMTKEQHALIIKEALRNYTNLSHHPDIEGKTPSFSRNEAAMILGCTFSFIAATVNDV